MKQSSLAAPLRKSGRGVAEREEERVKDEAIIISCTLRKSGRGVAEREEESVKDKTIIISCTLEKEWKRSCRKRGGEGER